MTEQAAAPAPQPQPDYSKIKFQFLEEPKQPGFLASLLRRHLRLITFIGALIVFGTFVVNEGLRNQLKDLIDSERTAQQASLNDVNASESIASYARIEQKVDSVRALIVGSANAKDFPDSYTDQLILVSGRIERCEDILHNIVRLKEQLPKEVASDVGVETAQILIDNAKDLFEASRKAGGTLYPDPTAYGGVQLSPINEALAASQKMKEFVAATMVTVISHSEEVRKRNEHRLSIWTKASYLLYALGWSLGLIGRLVGVNTGADE